MTPPATGADAPQADIVAFLADPATHGLGPGQVRHIRTHISDLFLAGDHAYKLKRAVAYAFVDFTTLEARHAACLAELELNRRTAPAIYLFVAAVRRDGAGKLGLDRPDAPAPGTPVDWVVVLRRFDDTATLDHLADRGQVTPAHIDAVIDAAVALHAGAAPVTDVCFGGAASLTRVIEENDADMGRLPAIFTAEERNALTAACRAALERVAPLLNRRRAQGFVRRCHGDLHLGNIVLWQDRPVLFDCIEFSEDIATIDVGYDIAFLLMDLETRGLRTLANRALARYVGRTGDTGFLAALGLMMAMRALVRAKVTAMSVTDLPAAEAAPLRARIRRLTTLAGELLAPAPAPRLIAVGGLSGTGKSTLAAALAPLLGRAPGALHVRSDVIRKRQAGVAPEQRLPPEAYNDAANRAVYDGLYADAAAALAAGCSVVVDAVFARPDERRAIQKLANVARAHATGLWLTAPQEVLMSRVGARTGDASDATPAVVAAQLGYAIGAMEWVTVDASGCPEETLAEAGTALGL